MTAPAISTTMRTDGRLPASHFGFMQREASVEVAKSAAEEQGALALPKVELRQVGLRYFGLAGETEALKDVSLKIWPGEFVAIIGQSGCGKSTLLSLISGILQPTEGAVLVDGKPVTGPSRKVGHMLQQDYLFEWRTILGNAVLGAEIQGADMSRARWRAEQLLVRYGLGQFLHHLPRQLSGGMRQRVALARTMTTEPDVVLLDEPFSAIDSQTRLALAGEIATILRREGKTTILVTHDIGEAISLADRVIVLSRRPGQVKSEHAIRFAACAGARPAPLMARGAPEFNAYFNALWQELEVHVEG
jgi:NitT/TauT family transport system ATP-binding protein